MPLVQCSCDHEFQDKQYGKGVRVATYANKDGSFNCTVCSTRHTKAKGGYDSEPSKKKRK